MCCSNSDKILQHAKDGESSSTQSRMDLTSPTLHAGGQGTNWGGPFAPPTVCVGLWCVAPLFSVFSRGGGGPVWRRGGRRGKVCHAKADDFFRRCCAKMQNARRHVMCATIKESLTSLPNTRSHPLTWWSSQRPHGRTVQMPPSFVREKK